MSDRAISANSENIREVMGLNQLLVDCHVAFPTT